MRVLCWLSILTLAASTFASGLQSKEFKAFTDGVRKYVELQQYLESSVSAQKSTNESEQIAARQQQLAGLIANARGDAHRGDVFTDEVAEQFHKIIRKALREPGGRAIRKTIEERDPVKYIALKVNQVYPDNLTRTTMSPTLLNRLPFLPQVLAYRIIGHALVLQDTKTNLIVDFIPNALP